MKRIMQGAAAVVAAALFLVHPTNASAHCLGTNQLKRVAHPSGAAGAASTAGHEVHSSRPCACTENRRAVIVGLWIVSHDGNTFTGTFTIEFFDLADTSLFVGAGEMTGERVTLE